MSKQLLVFCLITLCIGSLAIAAEKTISANGKVVDEIGQPVPGVNVSAVYWETEEKTDPLTKTEIRATTKSDTSGAFEIKVPPPVRNGGYNLVAYLEDRYLGWIWGQGEMGSLSVLPLEGHVIVVSKPVDYKRRVVDEDGKGLAGATITIDYVMRPNSETGVPLKYLAPLFNAYMGTTDSTGDFVLKGVPQGMEPATTFVTLDGYGYAAAEDMGKAIVMRKRPRIIGKLVDDKGQPVSDFRIRAYLEKSGLSEAATTKADGTFSITASRPGNYKLGGWMKDRIIIPVLKVAVMEDKDTTVPDVVATSGAILSGRFIDASSGKPVPGIYLKVEGHTQFEGGWENHIGPSNERGEYSINVIPGKVLLMGADSPTHQEAFAKGTGVDVPAAGLKNYDIKVNQCQEEIFRGKVVDAQGVPMTGAVVQAGSLTMRSNDQGAFEMHYLVGGFPAALSDPAYISAWDIKGRYGIYQQLKKSDLLKGDCQIVVRPTKTLRVRVVDSRKAPLQGVRVMLGSRHSVSGANGEAIFRSICYGINTLPLSGGMKGYYYPDGHRISGPGNPDWEETVEIVMQDAKRTQHGRVVDADGTPVSNACVYTIYGSQKAPSCRSSKDGSFSLEGLPDCPLQIYAVKDLLYGRMTVSKETANVVIKVQSPIISSHSE